MFKVVETFSGIGSQAKALRKAEISYEILRTVEWDINAMIAYDIIHNGKPNLTKYINNSKKELLIKIEQYSLSTDGKRKSSLSALKRLSKETLMRICHAIENCHNLVSINDVTEANLPEEIDLLTYSFPCQDLSIAHAWFGESGGIDRNANNRSSLLWEIERILIERYNKDKNNLPRFLLMENVNNICSPTHNENFVEWQNILKKIGYENKVYSLDASNFGIPQKRKRIYMISVLCDVVSNQKISQYFNDNDHKLKDYYDQKCKSIKDILRLDYSNETYLREAMESQPNNTESRRKILEESNIIYDGEKVDSKYALTITTKQDRLPNSGLVLFNSGIKEKIGYRNLTPRECFMLMGFDEEDFQALMDNNFKINSSRDFFTKEKLHRMAGNSIVVNVLVEIFKMINDIDRQFFRNKSRIKSEVKKAM